MQKHMSYPVLAILISVMIAACGGNKEHTPPGSSVIVKVPDPNKKYTLKEAIAEGFIKVSADGMGTFQNIRVNIESITQGEINLSVPAGIYFENPDISSQSLITAKEGEKVKLDKFGKTDFEVATFCTDVRKSVPANLPNWNFNANYSGGLDEVIRFYGSHERSINAWLEKKNEIFLQEENRLMFMQVVIWFYEEGEYKAILHMLAQHVFKNDIKRAKLWLDDIQAQAKELARMIKNRDDEALEQWLRAQLLDVIPTNAQIDRAVESTKDRLENARRRLRH
jgi:hypothetical protein